MQQTLPPHVIEALQAGNKVAAIKRLRAQQGISLKEAKAQVAAYTAAHPALQRSDAASTEGGVGRILLLIVGVSVIYTIYRYFSA